MRATTYNRETSYTWRERYQLARKLVSTIKILFNLGMARTFGKYRHTIWNGEFDYAVYEWRGKEWAFVTTPISIEQ